MQPLLLVALIQGVTLTHGPMLGHVGARDAHVWARTSAPASVVLEVIDDSRKVVQSLPATSAVDRDLCVTWTIANLEPAQCYTVRVGGTDSLELCTQAENGAHARIAFGSCASDAKFKTQPIWNLIATSGAQALVLLGDTPYIDGTDLELQRRRRREFRALPEFRALQPSMCVYATWDDHDFGTNDCDGRVAGKEHSRRAFLEYHANPSYGENDRGIYTSFRRGPIEVFLLDTRWFSRTEDSPFAPGKPTLLGAQQWGWLERALVASTAPFKIVACGMIWNDAVRPGKSDYWGAYPWERDAFFRMIGDKSISGVVLAGGDVHRSRVVRHATREISGYEITELITSPMAATVIDLADVLHPGLVWDAGVDQTAMILSADVTSSATTLEAKFVQAVTTSDPSALYTLRLSAEHLRAKKDMTTTSAPSSGFLFQTIRVGERDYRYAVYVPRDWARASGGPALVFLHGAGECGTDGALHLAQGLGTAIERKCDDWPFVVVFPQKPTQLDEWEDHAEAVLAMLDRAVKEHGIDPARVGLTGLSQGGHGAWELASRYPERFAAVAPICGYLAAPALGWKQFDAQRDWADARQTEAAARFARALATKPVWAFHGENDEIVPARHTRIAIDELVKMGAAPKITTYPGVAHNSWDKAYRDGELAAWFGAQLRE